MTRVRLLKTLIGIVVIVAVGVGGAVVGRQTASPRDRGFSQGNAAGYAEGVAVGRALQIGDSVPKAAQSVATSAFQAGYRAGAADVFGNYDGGWALNVPYVVTVTSGVASAPYRIASRAQLMAGTTYRLCTDGKTVCTS